MKNLRIMLVSALLISFIFYMIFLTANVQVSGVESPVGSHKENKANAPSDKINQNSIEVYEDKVVIKIGNASLSKYAGTQSMVPVFDKGANGIRIIPENEKCIELGDIVTYESDNGDLIVHRVIEIGEDEQGTYFVVKGDNNLFSDGKIRFSQIRYITIGILY